MNDLFNDLMELTLPELVRRRAALSPEAPVLRTAAGDLAAWELDAASDAVKAGLQRLGVQPGDVVAVMSGNRAEPVIAWFGIVKLGAVHAALNTEFRGVGLGKMLALSRPSLVICESDLLPTLSPALEAAPSVRAVVVIGPETPDLALPVPVVPWATLLATPGHGRLGQGDPRETAMLLFTSGTTGQSKACMLSHRYALGQAALAIEHLGFRADDVLYCCYPLFHVDAPVFTILPALALGATAAIGRRFSVSGFWAEVRAMDATVMDFLGATLTMLWKQPPASDDATVPVRLAWGIPRPEWAAEFERRFGLTIVDGYGLTEAGVPVFRPQKEAVPRGSCGRVVPPYELAILDPAGDGATLSPGEVGEIAIRSSVPGLLMNGYWNMPAETSTALRDGWLHTGDLGRVDDQGFFYFEGRVKDAIRRRGENISVEEVEEVVLAHPAVLEAAVVGVPSELMEDDVMLFVVARDGWDVTAQELMEFCEPRMARYMVPRYVEFVGSLPKTPTEKVERAMLREQGPSARAYDRFAGETATGG